VGKVIHGVCFPCFACTVMGRFYYAVDNRVAEVHIGACHIYFGTQHHLSFFYFSGVHLLEQFECLLYRAVAVRAFYTRLGGRAFLCGNHFGALFVYISFSFLDETDGEVPQLLEVVGCIIFISPLESEPLDIFLDGFHIFHVFFGRVGVVETQVTYSTIACGYPKIQANGLGMTDVEITVGLRRETGLDFSSVFTFLQVVLYCLFDEVQTSLFCSFCSVHFSHSDINFTL